MFIFIPQYSVQKHGMDTDTDPTVEGSFEFELVAKWVSLNTEPANIDRYTASPCAGYYLSFTWVDVLSPHRDPAGPGPLYTQDVEVQGDEVPCPGL